MDILKWINVYKEDKFDNYMINNIDLKFKSTNALRSYVEREKFRLDYRLSKDRLIVGSDGGIAYKLFEKDFIPPKFNSFIGFDEFVNFSKEYFDFMNIYLNGVRNFSQITDFGFVEIRDPNFIIGAASGSPVYKTGIGKDRIENEQQFTDFIVLVNHNAEDLDNMYRNVCESRKRVN